MCLPVKFRLCVAANWFLREANVTEYECLRCAISRFSGATWVDSPFGSFSVPWSGEARSHSLIRDFAQLAVCQTSELTEPGCVVFAQRLLRGPTDPPLEGDKNSAVTNENWVSFVWWQRVGRLCIACIFTRKTAVRRLNAC